MTRFVVFFLDRKKLAQVEEIYQDESEAIRDATDLNFYPDTDCATVWRYEVDDEGDMVSRGRTFVALFERTGYGL